MIDKLVARLNDELRQAPMINSRRIFALLTQINREVREHPWWKSFQERCPGWDLLFCLIDCDEAIDFGRRLIMLSAQLPNPLFRWAHATAHVYDNPDGFDGPLTEEDEQAADDVATCWHLWNLPVVEPQRRMDPAT